MHILVILGGCMLGLSYAHRLRSFNYVCLWCHFGSWDLNHSRLTNYLICTWIMISAVVIEGWVGLSVVYAETQTWRKQISQIPIGSRQRHRDHLKKEILFLFYRLLVTYRKLIGWGRISFEMEDLHPLWYNLIARSCRDIRRPPVFIYVPKVYIPLFFISAGPLSAYGPTPPL